CETWKGGGPSLCRGHFTTRVIAKCFHFLKVDCMEGRSGGVAMADKPRYSIIVCKGGGLITDTRLLVEHWRPGADLREFVKRVLHENLLGRYTAYRSKNILNRVFARRYLRPNPRPATILKTIVASGLAHRVFTELIFLFSCRSDPLLYDFTVQEYWP